MHLPVKDVLPTRCAIALDDRPPTWMRTIFQAPRHRMNSLTQCSELSFPDVENIGGVPTRDHQGMAPRRGCHIEEGRRVIVGVEHLIPQITRPDPTERAPSLVPRLQLLVCEAGCLPPFQGGRSKRRADSPTSQTDP